MWGRGEREGGGGGGGGGRGGGLGWALEEEGWLRGTGFQRAESVFSPVFPKCAVIIFHGLELWISVSILLLFHWREAGLAALGKHEEVAGEGAWSV